MCTTVNVGSERHLYMLTNGALPNDSEDEMLFCDELEGYTFFPYKGKLKNILYVHDHKADCVNARIHVTDYMTGNRVKVPCNVFLQEKVLFINEDNFNKFWNVLSRNICAAIRRNGKIEGTTQQTMNAMVNLRLLETPSESVEIDENFQLCCRRREVDIETQRLISKRDSAMSNHRIKYVYAKSNDLVHDKTCKFVKLIDYWDFDASEEMPKDRKICSKCCKKIYIRKAVKGDAKHFEWYERFLVDKDLTVGYLVRFIEKGKVKMFMDYIDELTITYKEDTWKIIKDKDESYELYHNNYVFLEDGSRYITSDFHKQNIRPLNLKGIFLYIESYDWKIHLKKTDEMANVEKEEIIVEQKNESTTEAKETLIIKYVRFMKLFFRKAMVKSG